MPDKRKMNVKIGGVEYTIVSTEEDEYVQKVALFVDRKMNEISNINGRLSTSMVAILTAINFSDEYLKTLSDLDNLREQILKYAEEVREKTTLCEQLGRENESYKRELHRLQIEIAKKDAKLSN